MPADLMIDLSSNNPIPDLKKHWDAGYRDLALKATENTNYAWAKGQALADEWHKFGAEAVVWWYHFARPGNATAQAKFFLATIAKHRKPQDRLVLDAEIQGVDGKFSDEFFNVVHAAAPNKEEIYGSPYFIRNAGIKPNHEQGLWLAEYGPKADLPPGWKTWDAWQYTDRATNVPGEAGQVDESHLAKSPAKPAAPKPAPKPVAKPADKPAAPAPKPAAKPAPKVVANPFRISSTELTIKRGSKDAPGHQGVHYVQWALGRKTSGKFGWGDCFALKKFQKANHLTRDGVVGPKTLAVLKKVTRRG